MYTMTLTPQCPSLWTPTTTTTTLSFLLLLMLILSPCHLDAIDTLPPFIYPEAATGVCLPSKCRTDCGIGTCPGCPGGHACKENEKCASGKCHGGKCLAMHCLNNRKDMDETCVDGGGAMCARCEVGKPCLQHSDCVSSLCVDSSCAPFECSNGILDPQLETDVDCGGTECPPCGLGQRCVRDKDCLFELMGEEMPSYCGDSGICRPESCRDGSLSVLESDLDCGGPCQPCNEGFQCFSSHDCQPSTFCHKHVCISESCRDKCGVSNACAWKRCEIGQECVMDEDCDVPHARCSHSRCVWKDCTVIPHSGGATDVSGCGGLSCPPCSLNRACIVSSDCETGLQCDSQWHKCALATCFDGKLSPQAGETCVDGGGNCLRRCPLQARCVENQDCEEGLVCKERRCVMSEQDEDVPPPPPPPEGELSDMDVVVIPHAPISDVVSCLHIVDSRLVDGHACDPHQLLPPANNTNHDDAAWKSRITASLSRLAKNSQRAMARALSSSNSPITAYSHFAHDPSPVISTVCSGDCSRALLDVNIMTRPHNFYDIPVKTKRRLTQGMATMNGFYLHPSSSLHVPVGIDAVSRTSIIGRDARLVLEPNTNGSFLHGLVVAQSGGVLELQTNAMAQFSFLIVHGRVILGPGSRLRAHTLLITRGGQMQCHSCVIEVSDEFTVDGGHLIQSGADARIENSQHIRLTHDTTWDCLSQSIVTFINSSMNSSGSAVLQCQIKLHGMSTMRLDSGGNDDNNILQERDVLMLGAIHGDNSSTLVVGNVSSVVGTSNMTNGNCKLMILPWSTLTVLRSGDNSTPVIFTFPVTMLGPSSMVTSTLPITFQNVVHMIGDTTLRATSVFESRLFVSGVMTIATSNVTMELAGSTVFASLVKNNGRMILRKSSRTLFAAGFTNIAATTTAQPLTAEPQLYVYGSAIVLGDAVTSHLVGNGSLMVDLDELTSQTLFRSFSDITVMSAPRTKCPSTIVHIPISTFGLFASMRVIEDTEAACARGTFSIAEFTKTLTRKLQIPTTSSIMLTSKWGTVLQPHEQVPDHVFLFSSRPLPRILHHHYQNDPYQLIYKKGHGSTLEFRGRITKSFPNVDFSGSLSIQKHGFVHFTHNNHAMLKGAVDSLGEIFVEHGANVQIMRHLTSYGNFSVSSNLTLCGTSLFHDFTMLGGHVHVCSQANFTVDGYALFSFGDFTADMFSTVTLNGATATWKSQSVYDSKGFTLLGPNTHAFWERDSVIESSGEVLVDRGSVLSVETQQAYLSSLEVVGSVIVRPNAVLRVSNGFFRCTGIVSVETAGTLRFVGSKRGFVSGFLSAKGANAVISLEASDFRLAGVLTLQDGILRFVGTTTPSLILLEPPNGKIEGTSGILENCRVVDGQRIVNDDGTSSSPATTLQTTSSLHRRRALTTPLDVEQGCGLSGGDEQRIQIGGATTTTFVISQPSTWSTSMECSRTIMLTSYLVIAQGTQLVLSGGLVMENNGRIEVERGATVTISSEVTVRGGSIIEIMPGATISATRFVVHAGGRVDVAGSMAVVNTLIVHDGGEIDVHDRPARLEVIGSTLIERDGFLYARAGAALQFNVASSTVNHGQILAWDGEITCHGAYSGRGLTSLVGGRALFSSTSSLDSSPKESVFRVGSNSLLECLSDESVAFWRLEVLSGSKAVFNTQTTIFVDGGLLRVVDSSRIEFNGMVNGAGAIMLDKSSTMDMEQGEVLLSGHVKLGFKSELKIHSGTHAKLHGKVELGRHASLMVLEKGSVDVIGDFIGGEHSTVLIEGVGFNITSPRVQFSSGTKLVIASELRVGNLHCMDANEGFMVQAGAEVFVDVSGELILAPCAAMMFASNAWLGMQGKLVVSKDSVMEFHGIVGDEGSFMNKAIEFADTSRVVVMKGGTIKAIDGATMEWSTAKSQVLGTIMVSGSSSRITLTGGELELGTMVIADGAALAGAATIIAGGRIVMTGNSVFAGPGPFHLHNDVHVMFVGDVCHIGVQWGVSLMEGAATTTTTTRDGDALIEIGHATKLEIVLDASIKFHTRSAVLAAVREVDKMVIPVWSVRTRRESHANDDVVVKITDTSTFGGDKTLIAADFMLTNETNAFISLSALEDTFNTALHLPGIVGMKSMQLLFTNNKNVTPQTAAKIESIVVKYLGGLANFTPIDASVRLLFVDVDEFDSFCTTFVMTKTALTKELQDTTAAVIGGGATLIEWPVMTCLDEKLWPLISSTCVTDGLIGSALKGEACQMPMEFHGVEYAGCALDAVLGEWCLTVQGHWGGCICEEQTSSPIQLVHDSTCYTNGIGPSPRGSPCRFPFQKQVNDAKMFHQCVGSGWGNHDGFCRDVQGRLGGCDCTVDSRSNGSSVVVHSDAVPMECITNGRGLARIGHRCMFGFKWNGFIWNQCVGTGFGGEGFCMDSTGKRGGCICERMPALPTLLRLTSGHEIPYFVQGPQWWRNNSMVWVQGALSWQDAEAYVDIWVMPAAASRHTISSTLPFRRIHGGTFLQSLAREEWDCVDVYFGSKNFEQQDVQGNALLNVCFEEQQLPAVGGGSEFLVTNDGLLRHSRVMTMDGQYHVALHVRPHFPVVVKVTTNRRSNHKVATTLAFGPKSWSVFQLVKVVPGTVMTSHAFVSRDSRFSGKWVDVMWHSGDGMAVQRRLQAIPSTSSSSALVVTDWNVALIPAGLATWNIAKNTTFVFNVTATWTLHGNMSSSPSLFPLIRIQVNVPSAMIQATPAMYDFTPLTGAILSYVPITLTFINSGDVLKNEIGLDIMVNATVLDPPGVITAQTWTVMHMNLVTTPQLLVTPNTLYLSSMVSSGQFLVSGAEQGEDVLVVVDDPGMVNVKPSLLTHGANVVTITLLPQSIHDTSQSRVVTVQFQNAADGTIWGMAMVNIVTRALAIVTSSRNISADFGQVSFHLTTRPDHTINISLVLSPSSQVCLDLDLNWTRPCPQDCVRCEMNDPMVRLNTYGLTFNQSDFAMDKIVRVQRAMPRHVVDDPLDVMMMHIVESDNLPVIFGPNDDVVAAGGILIVGTSGLTMNGGKPWTAEQRVTITRYGTTDFAVQFVVRPRDVVQLFLVSGSCMPRDVEVNDTLQASISCDVPPYHGIYSTSSLDEYFDGLIVDTAWAVGGSPTMNNAGSTVDTSSSLADGLSYVMVGVVTGLVTLVSVLAVWVFWGPGMRTKTTMMVTMTTRFKMQPSQPAATSDAILLIPPRPTTSASSSLLGAAQRNAFAEVFRIPPPSFVLVNDAVIAYYEFDDSYHVGRVRSVLSMDEYCVDFADGDVDDHVELANLRLYDRQTVLGRGRPSNNNNTLDCTVTCVELTRGINGFGLKIGWTTQNRVVVTGFVVGGPAATCVDIALGDEIVTIGEQAVAGMTFEIVREILKGEMGVLKLTLKPASAFPGRRDEELGVV